MLKYLLISICCVVFFGCSDISSANEICYDKKLGYDELCSPNSPWYTESKCEQWMKEASNESGMFDKNYYIIGEECLENVRFN